MWDEKRLAVEQVVAVVVVVAAAVVAVVGVVVVGIVVGPVRTTMRGLPWLLKSMLLWPALLVFE